MVKADVVENISMGVSAQSIVRFLRMWVAEVEAGGSY